MTKYRLRVTKILEDGTEVELANVLDADPWYMAAVMADWVKRLRRMPRPPMGRADGQAPLGEAA